MNKTIGLQIVIVIVIYNNDNFFLLNFIVMYLYIAQLKD